MIRWIVWGAVLLIAFGVTAVFVLYKLGESDVKHRITADPDGFGLEQVRAAGVDLSTSREVRFYLYLPDKDTARRAGERLVSDGYEFTVHPAATGTGWLCLLTRTVVPDRPAMLDARKTLTALATELHGEYDGWEIARCPEDE